MRIIFMLAILFLFASCGRSAGDIPETDYTPVFAGTAGIVETAEMEEQPAPPPKEWTDPWRAAYAELLRSYENVGYSVSFFLHDMTGSGIPEIFLAVSASEYAGEDCFVAVYSFGFGAVRRLEIGNDRDFIAFMRGAARTAIYATPANAPGLVVVTNGPTAALTAGVSTVYFWRYGIEQGVFGVETCGKIYTDLNALYEIFGTFHGVDPYVREAAIREHSHYVLGNEIVAGEYFASVFGMRQVSYDGFAPQERRKIFLRRLTEKNEILTAWQPDESIFRTTQRVHPALSEFAFYRVIGERISDNSLYNFAGIERYAAIIIEDENGNRIQEIGGIAQGGHSSSSLAVDDNTFGIRFADFNFDGYLDMWVHYAINHGSAGGAWARYWLWNAETTQFEENAQLRQIHNMSYLSVDADARQISDRFRDGGYWRIRVFEYENGEFVLVDFIEELVN